MHFMHNTEKILKQVQPGLKIDQDTLSQAEYFVFRLGLSILAHSNMLLTGILNPGLEKRKALSVKEIKTSVKIILPSGLAEMAIRKATTNSNDLQINTEQMKQMMKQYSPGKTIKAEAVLYFSHICEYIFQEIFELAGNSALDDERNIIWPKDLFFCTHYDWELQKLKKTLRWEVCGGLQTIPTIHAELLPAKTPKNTQKKTPKKKKKKSAKKSTKKKKAMANHR